jgi:hypothetical protein
MKQNQLSRRLSALRRRVLAVDGAAGLGWGLTAAVAALLSAAWIDLIWDLPPAARIGAWGLAGLAAVGLPAAFVMAAGRRAADRRLADLIDAAGGTPGSVRAGWELSRVPAFASPLTAGLAGIAVARAEREAAHIPAAAVVPAAPLRRSLLGATAIGAVVGLAVLAAPELAWTEWRRFARPFEEVAPYSAVTVHVEPGDAAVVYGAGIDIRVRTEGPPVERVELVLHSDGGSEETLPMFPDAGGVHRTTLTSITAAADYYVRADDARSRRFRLSLITVPRLERLRVRIAPPEYADSKPYEGPLPAEGIVGLKNTEVTFFATSNRPLSGGVLAIKQAAAGPAAGDRSAEKPELGEPIPLKPLSTNDVTVSGSFRIVSSGTFELRVTDVAGESSRDAFSGAVHLAEDQRPFVRILQPREHSLAVPTATIPVEWSAEDDYGVSRLTLFRSLNGSAWLPLELPVASPARRRNVGSEGLPLSAYGLEPGDEIKLFVRVEDNDPAGAKGAESNICLIRIISQEDFQSLIRRRQTLEMLASKYRAVQRRLAALKEKKEGLRKKVKDKPQDAEADAEDRAAVAALQKQLENDLAALKAAAANKLPYDMDKSLAEHLQRHVERMQRAADGLQRLSKNSKPTNADLQAALDAMSKEMDEADLDVEAKMMEPIEKLELIFPLISDSSKFTQLVARQRELAERIAALKGNDRPDDPSAKARMRDLEEEQAEIRESLLDLLDEIESHAERLPDDDEKLRELKDSAQDFVRRVRETGATDDMSEAETALSGFVASKAADEAKEAADKLEKLLAKCRGMEGQGGTCLRFAPGMSQCLGNTVAQLLAQMGLGTGSGPGTGAGGGSSAARSGMDRMGLYGDLPAHGGSDGGTGEELPADEAAGRGFARNGDGRENRNTVTADGAAAAEGTSRFEAPPVYRRRVADYFRRLAEDINE